MLAAFFHASHGDQNRILRSYNLMPTQEESRPWPSPQTSRDQPSSPVPNQSHDNSQRQSDESRIRRRAAQYAFLPKYPGLRVQVHKIKGETHIFTSRLHNITTALNGLSQQLGAIEEDFIVDADLIGFQEGKICRQSEMLKYINRRRLSRRSRLSPALLAYDLIYQSGEDTCSRPYQERRKRLVGNTWRAQSLAFRGNLSLPRRRFSEIMRESQDYHARVGKGGGEAIDGKRSPGGLLPGLWLQPGFHRDLLPMILRPFDPWKSPLCTCPAKMSLNPYTGCPHGCIYCYASSVSPTFRRVSSQSRSLKTPGKRFGKIKPHTLVAMSNSSDPYPSMEKELRLVSRIACRY